MLALHQLSIPRSSRPGPSKSSSVRAHYTQFSADARKLSAFLVLWLLLSKVIRWGLFPALATGMVLTPMVLGAPPSPKPSSPKRPSPERPSPERSSPEPLSARQAKRILTNYGLTQRGVYWLSAEEAQLAVLERNLPRLRTRFWQVQGELERTSQELAQRDQLRLRRDQLQEALRQPNLAAERRRKLQQQLAQMASGLRGQAEALAKHQQVSNGWWEVRQQLLVDCLTFRRLDSQAIRKSYEPLENNPVISPALKALGQPDNPARLGPRDQDQRRLRDRVAQWLEPLLGDSVPMRVRMNRGEIPVIVAEKLTVTACFRRDQDFSLCSKTLLKQLNLVVPDEAGSLTLYQGHQAVEGRIVALPAVRLGQYVLRDVEVLVLPDRYAPAILQLGQNAFRGYEVQVDSRAHQLRLSPAPTSGKTVLR